MSVLIRNNFTSGGKNFWNKAVNSWSIKATTGLTSHMFKRWAAHSSGAGLKVSMGPAVVVASASLVPYGENAGTRGLPGCRCHSRLSGNRAAPPGEVGLQELRVQADATLE